jgi:hypothetical protein
MSKVDLTLKLSHHSKIFRFCCHVFPVSVYRREGGAAAARSCIFEYFRGVHWPGTSGSIRLTIATRTP